MRGEATTIEVRGEACPAPLFRPTGPGPHPAVAIGQEAIGTNEFIRTELTGITP